MNNIKRVALALVVMVLAFSCKDEDAKPILTFEDAGKGAYARLVEESGTKLVNLLDVSGSAYSWTVEFVSEDAGKNVATYRILLDYDDNDPSNGDLSATEIELFSFAQGSMSANANGYIQTPSIDLTGTGLVSAVPGLTEGDVSVGDNFNISGVIVLDDGREFRASNSSSTVNGAAFRGGNQAFTMPANCPSDLTGTYDYVADLDRGGWAAGTVTGTVDIIANGGGSYDFSDWSFGGYQAVYGCCTPGGDFDFTDVCGVVTFNTEVTDGYGDSWDLTVDIPTPTTLTILYDNYTYAGGFEGGFVTITFPDGVPFTLP